MMISTLVLALALMGGVNERFDADQLEKASSEALQLMRQLRFSTKADLEAWVSEHDGAESAILRMLDVNEDGVVDIDELAVLEMESGLALTEEQALILANGAVREDGDIETAFVSSERIVGWVTQAMWKDLLESADEDGDGVISNEEWDAYIKQTAASQFDALRKRPVATSSDTDTVAPSLSDASLPAGGLEALVAAGVVLGQLAGPTVFSTRRRFQWQGGLAASPYFSLTGTVGLLAIGFIVAAFIAIALYGEYQRSKEGYAQYLGCYVDDWNRDMEHEHGRIYGARYIEKECSMICKGYLFFSLQAGNQCWCSNSYNTQEHYKKVDDRECTHKGKKKTGGALRNAVYSHGYSYEGCYSDNWDRALDKEIGYGYKHYTCFEACKEEYLYFAIQDGSQCFCGHSYGDGFYNYVKMSDSFCEKKGKYTGDRLMNSVFKKTL